MDILRLLDELHDLACEQPHHVVGPLYWGLDTDEISMQITKIRASLPQDLKVAVTTARETDRLIENAKEDAKTIVDKSQSESERIIADARAEAERILEQARIQQTSMVADNEILKLTKAQSEEIRNAAERDATSMRRGAEKYAFDVLSQLEGVVGKVMTTIDKSKAEIAPRDTASIPQTQPRERTRV